MSVWHTSFFMVIWMGRWSDLVFVDRLGVRHVMSGHGVSYTARCVLCVDCYELLRIHK